MFDALPSRLIRIRSGPSHGSALLLVSTTYVVLLITSASNWVFSVIVSGVIFTLCG